MRSLFATAAPALLLAACGCSAELLEEPRLRFAYTLDGAGRGIGGRGLRRGNAVVVSPDGGELYATADDGSLHVVSVADPAAPSSRVFVPPAIGRSYTEGRSGVALVEAPPLPPQEEETEDEDGAQEGGPQARSTTLSDFPNYLVYATVHTPRSFVELDGEGSVAGKEFRSGIESRVFGVNPDDASLRWEITLDGAVVGTPAVGSNGRTLYVSHTVDGKGYLSVIATDGGADTAEVVATLAAEREVPLGPAVVRAPLGDEAAPGLPFGADFVVVAENPDNGYSPEGGVYLLSPSTEFEDLAGRTNESYQLTLVSREIVGASMAPLFVGNNLWLGGTASEIAGWADNGDLQEVLEGGREGLDPRWNTRLQANARNATMPFGSTPAISSEGDLFLSGASNNLFSLEGARGRQNWAQRTASAVLNSPVVFEEDNNNNNKAAAVVYAIESMDGRVRQFNADDGEANWEFSCLAITGSISCQDSVEAEFALSPSGNVLYYGDVFGRIHALEVAEFATPAPTAAPTGAPSAAPTGAPTVSPAPTPEATPSPTAAPTPRVQGLFPTRAPSSPGIGIFDDPTFVGTDSLNNNAATNDDGGGAGAGLLAGVVVAGLLFIGLAVCLVSRALLPRKQKKSSARKMPSNGTETGGVPDPHDEDDDEDPDGEGHDYYDEEGLYDYDADVTVNTGDGNSVEVEVGANYQTPRKRVRRKRSNNNKARTPPTPLTLESIEEGDDEEQSVVPHDDDDDDAISNLSKRDLDARFQAAIASIAEHSQDPNVSMEIDADEDSVESEDSVPPPPDGVPPPPPPPTADRALFDSDTSAYTSAYSSRAGEEKKDDPTSPDRSAASQKSFLESVVEALSSSSRPTSPVSGGMATPSRSGAVSPISASSAKTPPSRWDVKSLGSLMGSQMSPDAASTDSSLYTDQVGQQPGEMSPLSPHVLSKSIDEGAPDDELMAAPGASLMLKQTLSTPVLGANDASLAMKPTLSTPADLSARFGEDYDAPDDEASQDTGNMMTPGSHYIKPTPLRPRFTPSSGAGVAEGVKSARAKRDQQQLVKGGGFQSLSTSGASSKRAPSFKRRSRRGEDVPQENSAEDTWSSFLSDLAAAEQTFFSPSHAQKTAVLDYEDETSGMGGSAAGGSTASGTASGGDEGDEA